MGRSGTSHCTMPVSEKSLPVSGKRLSGRSNTSGRSATSPPHCTMPICETSLPVSRKHLSPPPQILIFLSFSMFSVLNKRGICWVGQVRRIAPCQSVKKACRSVEKVCHWVGQLCRRVGQKGCVILKINLPSEMTQ